MDTKVADPMRGALLGGRYRIMGRLARGGMATVYQARDERLERPVAIKIIEPDHADDPEFVRRLGDEAKTVARLSHPNVVAVYDQGTYEDSPYVVMEFVRGRTLREVLADRRRLDPSESLAILEQILAALAVAHRAGLVHRDVKPENILISPPPNGSGDLIDGVVKVADFGLAHPSEAVASEGDKLLATAEYVAPELVADRRADARSDIYSTGIVLFEMLTGRPPFEGDRPADVAWQHVDREVPAPSRIVPGLPAFIDGIVERATRRDPTARPRDAAAMLAEVQAAREDLGALAGPTRALAHPTVVVGQVVPSERPAWAKLPGARAPMAPSPRGRSAEAATRSLPGFLQSLRDRIEHMRGTDRGRRQLIAILSVVGLLLATGGWWVAFGRYTEAPPLTARTVENATAEAQRQGFTVEIGSGIYDETIPKDTVMEQQPAAGGRILRGGVIILTLSLGPERNVVPDVTGQSLDFARTQLDQAKLVVQLVNGYSDTLDKDYVVSTDPAAGTPLKPGSVIKVVVAKGPYPVHVPSVVGRPLAEAESTLRGMGFQVEVQRKDEEGRARDEVLSQDPPAGQGMAKAAGVKVTIVVANGPPGNPMPNVQGQPCGAARDQLQAMGFQVDVQGDEIAKQLGRVQEQQPGPDQPVQPGQQVMIKCAIF